MLFLFEKLIFERKKLNNINKFNFHFISIEIFTNNFKS